MDSEIRTRSIPTAAYLMLSGFQPLGLRRVGDAWMIRFSSDAGEALGRFLQAKAQLDLLIEREDAK
jgi:hypothetical protein